MMQRMMSALWIAFLGMCLSQPVLGIGITGTVVDYHGLPIEGAEVVVIEQEIRYNFDYDMIAMSDVVHTNAQGGFALDFDCHDPREVYVVARKSGYALAWDRFNPYVYNYERREVFLVLEKPCTQSGQILDAQGQPVANAVVQVIPRTCSLDYLTQTPILGPMEWFTCETDDLGIFAFKQLSADSYSDLEITPPESTCTEIFTPHVQFFCGYQVGQENIRLRLAQKRAVKGTVVDSSGQPIADITLEIHPERSKIKEMLPQYRRIQTTSDHQGRFIFDQVPPGSHRISVVNTQEKSLDWVGEPISVDLGLDSNEPLAVTFPVEKGGLLKITILDAEHHHPLASSYVSTGSQYQWTDQQGIAQFYLLAGDYALRGWRSGYTSNHTTEPVTVKAGVTTTHTLILEREPYLTGMVKNASQGIEVSLHPFGDHAVTDSQGAFLCGYDLDDAEEGLYVIARDTQRSLVAFEKVTHLDQPISLELSLSLTARGKIIDTNGRPIPAAHIELDLHDTHRLFSLSIKTVSDSEGAFTLDTLPRIGEDSYGRLRVFASGYTPKDGERIDIQGIPGQTTILDPIVMQPAQSSVSGVILDANGLPVPDIFMILNGDDIEQPEKATVTDDQGRFSFNRIGKGRLCIQLNYSSSPGGLGWLYCHAGDHGIKAIQGQTNVHEPFQTLLDNPLPDLASLSPDLGQALQADHPTLLLFVDIELRSARHCLSQLAEQLDHFKEQGLQILIIQMSPVELSSYQDWLDKNGITLPIYPVEGDLVQKKYDWGVKSLPWLILTDQSQTVVAEGISVDKLGRQLTEIAR